MSRQRSSHRCMRLIAFGAAMMIPLLAVGQDRTADWLEANGLDSLLALHLERERAQSAGDGGNRARIAIRLADVYARQLKHERDPEERARIIAAAENLLESGDAKEADSLRLALFRARYVTASDVLESARAGLSENDEEAEFALSELTALSFQLRHLRKELDAKIKRTDVLLDRATGLRARRMQSDIERFQETMIAASLIQGWTLYYVGRDTEDRELLRVAEEAFGRVLQGDTPIPGLDEVSVDRQRYEFFASGMLGMAMTIAVLDGYNLAAQWFERLAMTVTWPSIRDALEGWRIAAAIDAQDFDAANELLEGLQEQDEIPAAWLRIAAVGGLTNDGAVSSAPRRLATKALAALAGRGELAQVVDLAERYGVEAMGEKGFAFRYVRGVRTYRSALSDREAGRSSDARRRFGLAADELLAASDEKDAKQFESAIPGCLTLAGWSLVEVGRFQEAADVFRDAAVRSHGARRADAEWGAIVSLDRIIEQDGQESAAARRQRDELITAFLDRFPADERAPSLVVRRISGRDVPTDQDIETLMAVPSAHPSWEIARRRAAQARYRRFREAEQENRPLEGRAFLEVATELLERERAEDVILTDLNGLDGVLLRQVVEVSTHAQVAEIQQATRWIAMLDLAEQRGAFESHPDLPNELGYRRIALALARDDLVSAVAQLELMPVAPDTTEAERWTMIAAGRIHRLAHAKLQQGGSGAKIAYAVVAAGQRLLDGESTNLEEALQRERMLPIAASVAAARHALYLAGGDPEEGARGLATYQAILKQRPRDGSILEAAAELARALGEEDVSLEFWRRISAAAPRGTDRWWAARTNVLELLEKTDSIRARAVLDQHLQLYPDYGPEPWGARIRKLQDRLDIAEQLSWNRPVRGGAA